MTDQCPIDRLAALALLCLAASPASAAETRAFRDWTASCDDAGACAATTPALTIPGDSLAMTRSAGLDAAWSLGFSTHAALADRDRPVNLRVLGKAAVTLDPVTGYEPFGAPDTFYVTSSGAAARLYEAMAAGDAMRVEYVDVAGSAHDLDFSLSGLSAALLWIDERQGRLASPRRIAAPAAIEPAARVDEAALIAAAGVPPLLAEMHGRTSQCEAPATPPLSEIPPIIGALSDTSTLYALPCTAGAYQVTYRLYEVERGEIGGIRPLYFANYSAAFGWAGTDTLIGVDYDEATRTLTSSAKGRGLGDCGTAGTWVWHDYDFALLTFRAKEECDGSPTGDWPVVFSAKP